MKYIILLLISSPVFAINIPVSRVCYKVKLVDSSDGGTFRGTTFYSGEICKETFMKEAICFRSGYRYAFSIDCKVFDQYKEEVSSEY
jgi:hypothetical protein